MNVCIRLYFFSMCRFICLFLIMYVYVYALVANW